MRKVLFLFCLLAISCKEEEIIPPISVEKMKSIVLDIQLAETYSTGLGTDTTQNITFKKNEDSLALFYTSIWKHHDIDASEFENYYTWYKEHPIYLDSVFTLVLEEMSKEKAERNIEDLIKEEPMDEGTQEKREESPRSRNPLMDKKLLDVPLQAPVNYDTILKEATKELDEIN